ncbi:hypothetical protein [Kitasatospora sp. NPDC059673]|uniref:hypothetical protein n=1 Tax=Kitasatospora sp. NPDC059673 TaxID=3346901 RepID=UPI003676936D
MCEDLVEVDELVGPEFTGVLARLRAGNTTDEQVRDTIAELAEMLRREGLAGVGEATVRGEPGQAPFQPLPGLGPARPLEEVYVCPGDLCDRVEIPRPGAAQAPRCAVWASPLPRFRTDRQR